MSRRFQLVLAIWLASAGFQGFADELKVPTGTVAFSSLAPRGWDLYVREIETGKARRLTDHRALDYNAAFAPDGKRLAFVSERDGNLELYQIHVDGSGLKRLTDEFALDDHPAWSPDGKLLAFVSTRQPSLKPGRAWNAIYVMNAEGTEIRRLSPKGAADYSPAWSPKGDLIALASGSGKTGGTDLYVMKPDGGERTLVVKDGGWPSFFPKGQGLYFHSKRDGQWGIWSVKLDGAGLARVTPKDVEAFTPRVFPDGKKLVVTVKRGKHRQVELFDLSKGQFTPLTQDPADHWNPSISPDGRWLVYHKEAPGYLSLNVEPWSTPPGTKLQMLRLAGAFPAFSPDHRRVALTSGNFSRLDVMNLDGSERKTIFSTKPRNLFSLSWAHGDERIAFSHGTAFAKPEGSVDITLIRPDGKDVQAVTEKAGNNAFPSFSPDGKQLVFRSGREGTKNLYVMNRDGTGLRQLTRGKWTDTMTDWSPRGDWIAFASDRDGNFDIWLIRPDGTGLKKLIGGEGSGRHNHPHFSPDANWIVFTSQRAGFSAEEISLPFQFQPYGSLFAVRVDGMGLIRLTHNGFEEGTPAWGPAMDIKLTQEGRKGKGEDY